MNKMNNVSRRKKGSFSTFNISSIMIFPHDPLHKTSPKLDLSALQHTPRTRVFPPLTRPALPVGANPSRSAGPQKAASSRAAGPSPSARSPAPVAMPAAPNAQTAGYGLEEDEYDADEKTPLAEDIYGGR